MKQDSTSKRSWDFSRFWSKVKVSAPDDCWIWQAGTFKYRDNYGQFSINLRSDYAHRVSWRFVHGEIPEGMCVLHHCDNPICVNPYHLFIGDRDDNVKDMDRKNRRYNKASPGEANGMSKLTESDIPEIRKLYKVGKTQYEIAKLFDVAQTTIGRILQNKAWKHVE